MHSELAPALRARTIGVLTGAVLALAGAGAPPTAEAATQLQGFYEAFAQGTRADETWQFNMPNHYLELRVLSTPYSGVEAFVEVSGSSNRFRNRTPGVNTTVDPPANVDAAFVHDPQVFFNEGHVKLRGEHAELLFFSSQNRFWFSQPLLNTVDGNTLQDDFFGPRAQAVRLDFWELNGFGGLAYYGDKATNGEDFVATRIWRRLSGNRALLGATFGRKDFGSSTADFDMTIALDAELALGELIPAIGRFGRTTLVAEAARNESGWVDPDEDRRNGVQIELRDVMYKAFSMKLNGWYREPFLYTGMSNNQGNDDRKGFFLETWYRLPRKQIDLRYAFWGERAFDRVAANNERFEQYEHAIEAYAELKGGFSAWVKYRNYHTNDNLDFQSFENLIFELQGQNKLISVRPQLRIRDIGTPFEVKGYGMEINLNATSDWKFFARFLNAEENTESRRTFFLQARYNGFQNAEFFVEYGDGGRSDRLTENDFFVGEGPSATDQDSERRVQAFLKLWF